MIKAKIEIEPFAVPTGVQIIRKPGRRQDGLNVNRESSSILLKDLDLETLLELIEKFKSDVLCAANKD